MLLVGVADGFAISVSGIKLRVDSNVNRFVDGLRKDTKLKSELQYSQKMNKDLYMKNKVIESIFMDISGLL